MGLEPIWDIIHPFKLWKKSFLNVYMHKFNCRDLLPSAGSPHRPHCRSFDKPLQLGRFMLPANMPAKSMNVEEDCISAPLTNANTYFAVHIHDYHGVHAHWKVYAEVKMKPVSCFFFLLCLFCVVLDTIDDHTLLWLLNQIRVGIPQVSIQVRQHKHTQTQAFFITTTFEK